MSKKKLPCKYRQIACPYQAGAHVKIYVIDNDEKCCPCCGDDLENPRPRHYLYEEELSI